MRIFDGARGVIAAGGEKSTRSLRIFQLARLLLSASEIARSTPMSFHAARFVNPSPAFALCLGTRFVCCFGRRD